MIRVNHWATMALSASFLLLALLIAGLRGPENQHQAYAADTPAVESNLSTAVDNREEMDWSLVPAKAVFVAAARPAAIFRRPEFVAHGKLLDETSSSLKVTETEQVTVAAFDLPAVPKKPRSGPLSYSDIMNTRPSGVIIYQMTKPCQFADFLRETRDVEKREYRGRTYLFDVSWPVNSTPRLRIDDRTLVIASSEEAIRLYIQTIELGKDFLGRPKFIDRDQWKLFQSDQTVVAARAQAVEEGIKLQEWIMDKPEPYLATIAPVCQETTQGIAGIRFDDEVKVHAILIGRSAEAAEKVEKEVEAARLLAATVVQALTMQSRKGQPWPVQCATEVTGRILAATRTQREGVVVGMRSAVSMASVTKALPSIAAARQSAQLGQARNNMRMLALAMYNYNNVYQHFPPAVLYGPDGKTPYSWRVAVLPFLEQEALYKQYHFDEPWDGPNNRKLLEKMPAAFRSPTEPAGSKNTNASYFVLGGPGTIFDGNKGTAFKEITDGLANTILLVEAKRDIPWTKPEDILYDPDKPLPELGGYFPGVVNTAFADATVRGLPSNISDKVLRPLITKADGQAVKIPPDVP
ncbi:MAG: DUF1559 domain-containing protein [Thermoguttaceae bacterium]